MQFISDKIRYAWFMFTVNWARYVILACLMALVFGMGYLSGY